MMRITPAEGKKLDVIKRLFTSYRHEPKWFLVASGAKLIDASKRGNELYGIDMQTTLTVHYPTGLESTYYDGLPDLDKFLSEVFTTPVDSVPPSFPNFLNNRNTLKILFYSDPSTNQLYISFVPYYIKKADDGMAWKFQLTRDEYDGLVSEA